jgi:hypothetical protein
MIDWNTNMDEAPRTGERVLIFINDRAWDSSWNRIEGRWECLTVHDKPEAWSKRNVPVKPAPALPPGLEFLK